MKYKVLKSIWFDKIGIVKVQPEYGEPKFYMRQALGLDQAEDEQYIATYGYPVYPEALKEFFQ